MAVSIFSPGLYHCSGCGSHNEAETASLSFITEAHSLSAREAQAKSFFLHHFIAQGQENNILCFVSGVAQTAGVDFSASGNSITWNDLGLDYIGLNQGDTFIIHYIKA